MTTLSKTISRYLLLLLPFTSSCTHHPEIENVSYDLGPFKNGMMTADLTEAVFKGIEIPTSRQIPSGYFKIAFRFNNPGSKKYFYKIYYQNETYKFPEENDSLYNPCAEENFYGSWEDVSIGFKPLPGTTEAITDSIKISGNPRDEKKYYGALFESSFWGKEDIDDEMKKIKSNPEWYAGIKKKAEQNKTSTEDQLMLDAKWILKTSAGTRLLFSKEDLHSTAQHIQSDSTWYASIKGKALKNKIGADEQLLRDAQWVLENDTNRAKQNNRWKRNPRMGKYSLMIVVASEDDLANIPGHIQHLNLTSDSGLYINPYYFFKNKKNLEKLPDTKVFIDTAFITVSASLDPASGIYASGIDYPEAGEIPSSEKYGWTKNLYMNAQFSQFFSALAKDLRLNTIPLIKDVNDSSYTLEEYMNALKKFPEKDFIHDYIRNTDKPGDYIKYNEAKKAIEIITPGNKDLSKAHKTNMGVKTRIGFTYGKITAKVKFPELINKYNVWNGLTNAFWLLFQDEHEWNSRRTCKTGYTTKGDNREDAPRFPTTHYSEIDFEMVKTSPYWTKEYYNKSKVVPDEDAQKTDDIVVACTNWDMTCKDCKKYTVGIDTIHYGKQPFETNRWFTAYQALTTRTPQKDDELFKGSFYYYQFEWTPTHIIWRIGPDKNNLRVVGYMDSTVTCIPNNQMIAVLTQEYHLSEWWPPIPFRQEYIPFPKNDIKGELYELTIE